ncbi:MAG: peptide-methionine (S)-S-oxide reductase, partial [Verrucomicrobiota bacterium]
MKALLSILALSILTACNAMSEEDKKPAPKPEVPEGAEVATLGAGCFWCVEAVYDQIDGVYSSTSGYMGGTVADPTYKQVVTGSTGHAEVVQVGFDPQKHSDEKLLEWVWARPD